MRAEVLKDLNPHSNGFQVGMARQSDMDLNRHIFSCFCTLLLRFDSL